MGGGVRVWVYERKWHINVKYEYSFLLVHFIWEKVDRRKWVVSIQVPRGIKVKTTVHHDVPQLHTIK